MFEQVFKKIDDLLWKDAGCTSELDYTEQTSWMLFLKYLDDLETAREGGSLLLAEPYRWKNWAVPRDAGGNIDRRRALTGEALCHFVNEELFPYLEGFRRTAKTVHTLEYKIGEIFGEIRNRVRNGHLLRAVLELVDTLRFQTRGEKHELSYLYEAKIRNMGNAGRNGGEYYTPRPLVRAMVRVINPAIGERIYDGAAGSAGFLCEAYEYLKASGNISAEDLKVLHTSTFYGKEKKPLAYVIAIMNMILHGIEVPNIVRTNTLAEDPARLSDADRYDVILANPPFGGKERTEIQQNFEFRTGETAFLFLQHFVHSLKNGGRAAVVIKNTFLSYSDLAIVRLRKWFLECCNLHTILDCPTGTFPGAGIRTVVLFFEKGRPTRRIWYYQLSPGRTLGKTNALNDGDLAEFVELQKTFADSPRSWSVDLTRIDPDTYDLSVRNPGDGVHATFRHPEAILEEMEQLDARAADALKGLRAIL